MAARVDDVRVEFVTLRGGIEPGNIVKVNTRHYEAHVLVYECDSDVGGAHNQVTFTHKGHQHDGPVTADKVKAELGPEDLLGGIVMWGEQA